MKSLASDRELEPPSAHRTRVDLAGLFTVLARNLYSTPEVALRELVQNAHDSLVRRRLEDAAWPGGGAVRVVGDQRALTLTVSDAGAGLTADEIHRYLATVGMGYTRTIRDRTGSEELIGLFGLGFLSAFVLAERVTVVTTSFTEPGVGWRYESSDGQRYSVREVPPRAEPGTDVQIALKEAFRYIAAGASLERILGKYCSLLTQPVFLGEAAVPVNELVPPWRPRAAEDAVPHPAETRRQRLEFAKRFEDRFEPVCTMPIAPSGDSDARGLLWVQDARTYGTSDNRKLSAFVRGMLLDDDARDLLPAWAGFVGGVIESNRLTPTASREDLQRDEAYLAVQRAIEEALITGLADVAGDDPAAWRRVLVRHNESLLGAALCDVRLFGLLANELTVPTSQGDLHASALRTGGKLHVALERDGGFEEMLCRALRTPVARGDRYAVLPFLRQWAGAFGGQLVELGTSHGNLQMFRDADLEQADLAWLTERLCDGEELVPARFVPAELPLVVVPDREAELQRRLASDEADARISAAALRLARGHTAAMAARSTVRLYVNLDNAAVLGVLRAHRERRGDPDRAARLLWALKVVLAAGSAESGLDLNAALREMGSGVMSLVGDEASLGGWTWTSGTGSGGHKPN